MSKAALTLAVLIAATSVVSPALADKSVSNAGGRAATSPVVARAPTAPGMIRLRLHRDPVDSPYDAAYKRLCSGGRCVE
jgi:hypothetical protein